MKRFKQTASVVLASMLFFSSLAPSEAASKRSLGSATIQVDKSPILQAKSTKARKVLVLKKGTHVSLISEVSGWKYVQYGKKRGYMQSKSFVPSAYKLVTRSTSPVYVSTSTKSKRVATLRANTDVTVSKVYGSWTFVTSGKTSGWTATRNLAVKVEKLAPKPSTSKTLGYATVQIDKSPILTSKTTKGRKVVVLNEGVNVTVLSEARDWKYVQYGRTKGYMLAKSFVPNSSSLVTRKTSSIYTSTSTKSKQVATLRTNTNVTVSKIYRSWAYVTSGKVSGWTAKSNLGVKVKETPKPTPPVVDPEPEVPTEPIVKPDPEIVTPVGPIIPDPEDPNAEFKQLVKSSYEKVSQSNEWQEPSAEVARLVNEYRVENGLNPLVHRQSLVEFAAFRWDDMKMNGYISHHSPTYGSFQEMTFKAGVGIHKFAGENISFNFMTPAQVVQGWKDSPPHNATMLSPDLTHSGVIWKDGIGVHIFEGDL